MNYGLRIENGELQFVVMPSGSFAYEAIRFVRCWISSAEGTFGDMPAFRAWTSTSDIGGGFGWGSRM
jgi:hypothetical protein